MRTKDDFHKLIDAIEDEEALKGYFAIIQRLNNNQTGLLWDELNSSEKEELLVSYEESLDPANLIAHDQVKKQNDKWLKK
ncbi:MAG: hypothetical protein WDN75_15400 [Bacteroidota bacterium]